MLALHALQPESKIPYPLLQREHAELLSALCALLLAPTEQFWQSPMPLLLFLLPQDSCVLAPEVTYVLFLLAKNPASTAVQFPLPFVLKVSIGQGLTADAPVST